MVQVAFYHLNLHHQTNFDGFFLNIVLFSFLFVTGKTSRGPSIPLFRHFGSTALWLEKLDHPLDLPPLKKFQLDLDPLSLELWPIHDRDENNGLLRIKRFDIRIMPKGIWRKCQVRFGFSDLCRWYRSHYYCCLLSSSIAALLPRYVISMGGPLTIFG